MPEKKISPYGSWKSPISTEMIVSESVGLGDMEIDGTDIYWLETRPSEGGRYVVVRKTSDGLISDVIPGGFSSRTTVHEYGCLLYTSPSPRDGLLSRMPSSA
mgnify:CR=1 FL=1